MYGRLILLVLAATLAAARGGELQVFSNAAYVAHAGNDGDSFLVRAGGAEHMVRLYFADCPEAAASDDTDRRRLIEQSRYFGVEDPRQLVAAGQAAAARTRELLARPFTLHTALAAAPGRSGRPRVYGMITLADGRDLAAVLVTEGLARNHGVQRTRPDGREGEEYARHLDDLELAAAMERRGAWQHSRPEALAALRQQQRDEDRALATAFGVFATVNADSPLDLNTCDAEALQQLRGIGEVLASRIVAGRPYRSVDDLSRVEGVGPTLIKSVRPYLKVSASPP